MNDKVKASGSGSEDELDKFNLQDIKELDDAEIEIEVDVDDFSLEEVDAEVEVEVEIDEFDLEEIDADEVEVEIDEVEVEIDVDEFDDDETQDDEETVIPAPSVAKVAKPDPVKKTATARKGKGKKDVKPRSKPERMKGGPGFAEPSVGAGSKGAKLKAWASSTQGTIVIVASALVMLSLAGTAVYLSSQADAKAENYSRNVNTLPNLPVSSVRGGTDEMPFSFNSEAGSSLGMDPVNNEDDSDIGMLGAMVSDVDESYTPNLEPSLTPEQVSVQADLESSDHLMPESSAKSNQLLADNQNMALQIEDLIVRNNKLKSDLEQRKAELSLSSLPNKKTEKLISKVKKLEKEKHLHLVEIDSLKRRLKAANKLTVKTKALPKPKASTANKAGIPDWTLKGVVGGKALFSNAKGRTLIAERGDVVNGVKITGVSEKELSVSTANGILSLK